MAGYRDSGSGSNDGTLQGALKPASGKAGQLGRQKNKTESVSGSFAAADGNVTPGGPGKSGAPSGTSGPTAVSGEGPANSGGGVTGLTR